MTINSPAFGIGYSLWLRTRWVLIALVIYIAALAIAVQLSSAALYIALVGTIASSMVIGHLLTVVTLGPSDLGVRGSGYPTHMFVLPTRTRALVGWPMLMGATFIAMMWIAFSALVLRPAGLQTPVFWPAALGAAATAWLQATGWSPFATPFARVPALVLALAPLILLGSCACLYLESTLAANWIATASLIWIAAAYLFAVNGLSRARAGSDGDWLRTAAGRALVKLQSLAGIRQTVAKRPPFHSASTAQLWHELRRNSIVLPVLFAFIAVPMMVMVLTAIFDGDVSKNMMFNSIRISPSAIGVLSLIGVFVWLSGMHGLSMGKFDCWGKAQMPSFFAIRPMTTPQFVIVKMLAAGLGTLVTWILLVALFLFWAIVDISSLNARESVVRAVLGQESQRHIAMFAAAAFGIYAFGWHEVAVGMWTTLAGHKWIANAPAFVGLAGISLAAIAGRWIYYHQSVLPQLLSSLPWLLAALLLIKLLVAGWIFRSLYKHKLISKRAIAIWLAGWLAASLALICVVCCFTPPTPVLILGMLMAVPLTRIAAAPLALFWSRHR